MYKSHSALETFRKITSSDKRKRSSERYLVLSKHVVVVLDRRVFQSLARCLQSHDSKQKHEYFWRNVLEEIVIVSIDVGFSRKLILFLTLF